MSQEHRRGCSYDARVLADEKVLERLEELITKGDQVLATHRPNPPGVIGFSTLAPGAFTEWRTQSLSFLMNLLGEGHVYVQSFRDGVDSGRLSEVHAGQGILRAVAEDVRLGFLADVRSLISADVFADFLDMADHLLEAGYQHSAASLSGAVLENGLRQIATKGGLSVRTRDDLSALNSKCAGAGIYNRLVQRKVQVWVGIRNHADHGEFSEYTEADVREMVSGVRNFLGAQV